MRISMIHLSNNGFPPDIRILKEARALASEGHHVIICTKKTSKAGMEFESYEPGIDVIRGDLKGPPSWFQRRKANVTLRESWVRPLVEGFLDQSRPDVVHVHDFPYLPLVLDCTEPRGLPVVADLHENMPAAKRAWRSHLSFKKWLKAAILFNYQLWCWHEKRTLNRCEKVLVVVPEAAERLYKYGIDSEKIVVVSNTEDESTFRFSASEALPEVVDKYADKWMVSYVGGIGPHRGWDIALEGAALAVERIKNFIITFVGTSLESDKILREKVQQLKITENVELISWQPFEKVNSYIHASKVCIIPHKDFEHTHTTVPHKLFQYMICEKPVLVSSCKPLERIVQENDCGYVFRVDDPVDFCDKLISIFENPSVAKARARNGRKAALGPYAWKHDAKRLVSMYEELERLRQ